MFFALLLLVYGAAAWAQIPNPGFEQWQSASGYEYPTGWGVVAQATNGVAVTCEKSTDKYSGNFAARLFTRDLGFVRVPGLLFTGKLDVTSSSVSGGFPYTGRPQTLTGYYKYTPGNSDTCAVFGFLTRTLPNGSRDTVAIFAWQGNAVTSYTAFSVPLVYLSNEKPDTGLIVISSSINPAAPAPGSVLWVDELAFEGGVSTSEPATLLPVSVWPNPATERLQMSIPHEGLLRVWLFDGQGRQIESHLISSGEALPVGHLPAGVYCVLIFEAGSARPLGYTTFQRL